MLLKRTTKYNKNDLTAIGLILMLMISGCGDVPKEEIKRIETANRSADESETTVKEENREEDEEEKKIIECCLELYEKASAENRIGDLEVVQNIVKRFGENGYPAVDSKNQVNMTRAEQVEIFCEMADAKKEAEVTVLQVDDSGAFAKYDLRTKDGKVDVVRSYYKYENGNIERKATGSYQADDWNYTKDGYLMFSGSYFSDESYVLTLSGAEEHTAFRVQPLDEAYRELCRKYLLPVGFERNNMFLVDWSEEDFGDLNFYDMYDLLYPIVYGTEVPYTAADDLGAGAVYHIPKDDFECVIMTFFHIDSETLQDKTVYCAEDEAYEYKPRGFEETEYPEYPYPEVVGFRENSDGTLTLTAHVVFPYAGESKVYAHEVTVRPLEDGGVQYVSNRILPSEDNQPQTWHTPRLTAEEWEEIYAGIQPEDKAAIK